MTSVWIDRAGKAWPEDIDPPDHAITTLRDLPTALGL